MTASFQQTPLASAISRFECAEVAACLQAQSYSKRCLEGAIYGVLYGMNEDEEMGIYGLTSETRQAIVCLLLIEARVEDVEPTILYKCLHTAAAFGWEHVFKMIFAVPKIANDGDGMDEIARVASEYVPGGGRTFDIAKERSLAAHGQLKILETLQAALVAKLADVESPLTALRLPRPPSAQKPGGP